MAATQHGTDAGDVDLRDRKQERRTHTRSRTPETKTFVSTSEFWMTLVAVGAIAIIYNAASDTSLDLWGACVLGIAAVVAYILSRGIAKAFTRRHDETNSTGYL